MANENIDFWGMTPGELMHECRLIASGTVPQADAAHRAEAGQLADEWERAQHMPKIAPNDAATRAARISALRKRTIEILVKVIPHS